MNDNNNISAEDRLKVYKLCKTNLSGEWAQIKEEDLFVDKISDGNVNQLFICGLPENGNKNCNKVVVRLDAQGFEDVMSKTHVLAINVILSAKNIAPKLVCAFDGGSVHQLIECRYFNNVDDQDNVSAQLLAKRLAQLHSVNMPIPKNTAMALFKSPKPFVAIILKSFKIKVQPQLENSKFEFLSKFNLEEEMDWLLKVIDELESPIVFSHNDFNKKNILVKDSKQLEIFLIDFDWSSYNCRGVDLGQYFSNWAQIEPEFGSGDFPTDQQMSAFIEGYIKEMCKIFGDSFAEKEINSKDRLKKEAKIFGLLAYMKDFMYFLFKFDQDKTLMQKGEIRMKCYDALKKRIFQEYNINLTMNKVI